MTSPSPDTKDAEALDQVSSAVTDLFQPRQGRDLIWTDLSMTHHTTNHASSTDTTDSNHSKKTDSESPSDKLLLDNVWGSVPAKQVTAILGPSGSGKSSLLNILSGRTQSNGTLTVEADVRLQNYTVDPTDLQVRKKIAFVAQDDSLPVTATPREAIFFSAKLRNPVSMSNAELETLTDKMLLELGLQDCANIFVGGALLKGISGGERKRTSVGVELVTRPSLVFLDEPTSGLDSFNALKLINVLSKIANAGSSVLCTIHQPSSEIFNAFDRAILLNKGRVMYQGPIADIADYFAERGFPCPPHYNTADHIMNTALAGGTIEELEAAGFFPKDDRDIGEAFVSTGEDGKDVLGITNTIVPGGETADMVSRDDPPPGFFGQTQMLFKREVLNLARDTHSLRIRIGMTIMISTVTGCLFYQIADNDFSQFINIQSTFGALLMALMANVIATAVPSLMSIPKERPVFLREYQTNHYSVGAYFLSRLTIEVFITALQVTVSSVITYFLCGFTLDYSFFWSALYVLALTSTALGVFVGCSVENPETAGEFLPVIFLPQILFSGFFVPPELMPNWLYWIQYLCPLTYGVWIVTAKEFDGRCDNVGGDQNYCDVIFDHLGTDPEDVWWYYLVLIVLFVVVRSMALFNLKRKSSKFY